MANCDEFELRVAAQWPPDRWADVDVITAFSGGPDSTALLAALAALRPENAAGRIVAAHYNHRLRGAESEADEAFSVDFAGRLQIECVVGRGDVGASAAERGEGIEEAARDARYRFLVETAAARGARCVATAHTLDDQAETVLHRLLRGTGPAGLAGIPSSRPLAGGAVGLVRPMLSLRRAEVLAYLDRRGLPHRGDSSNDDLRYTRNRIRRELLPQLAEQYNPRIVESLARLAAQADDLRELIAALVEPLLQRALVRADADGCELDCTALAAAPRHLVREVLIAAWSQAGLPLRAMGYDEWVALAELATGATTQGFDMPGGVRAQSTNAVLKLSRVLSTEY